MIMLKIGLERPRMLTFTSTAALCGVLEIAYRSGPGEPGRKEFEKGLQTSLKFSEKQARLYASTVLGNNSETSAGYVRTNAERLIGTWRSGGSNVLANIGYGGNALSTLQLTVQLDDKDHLVIGPGVPARLALDFNLAASNTVGRSGKKRERLRPTVASAMSPWLCT